MTTPGLLIAAPRSGAGKTTVALGLMMALRANGLQVAAAKCGPDYIDPAFHAVATGRPGVNLDSWAMPAGLIQSLAAAQGQGADLIIGEALMGLFDGVPGCDGATGASADIAALTGWPVLLVLDVSGQSQTAAALALGCKLFDPRIHVAGVILNRVGSERHRRQITDAMAGIGLPVLGALPRQNELSQPERHLGLVQARERSDLPVWLAKLGDWIGNHVDLAAVQALATGRDLLAGSVPMVRPPPGQRIALADDAAFSFTYPHLLTEWRRAGAEIMPFSPLANQPPPADCDACWLPGGYPELHAETLAACDQFLDGLRIFSADRPVHGECGGYMVLGRGLIDADGHRHAMAGLLPVETSFAHRKLHLGYRRLALADSGILGSKNQVWRGHEFHYASITATGDGDPLGRAWDGTGQDLGAVGHVCGRVSGSFFHLIARD